MPGQRWDRCRAWSTEDTLTIPYRSLIVALVELVTLVGLALTLAALVVLLA
jgi:hypothetical protein